MAEVEEYLVPEVVDSPPPEEDYDLEIKLEFLAILASMGGTKEYTGVDLSVDNVKKLSAKDVKKYHLRTQAVTGKQMTTGLVENFINISAQTLSHMLPSRFNLDSEQLAKDWNKNELLKKELTIFAGYLGFKFGRLLALTSALFDVVKNIKFRQLQQKCNSAEQTLNSTSTTSSTSDQ